MMWIPWAVVNFMEISPTVVVWTTVACVTVAPILAVTRKTRKISGYICLISSFIFGFIIFGWSCIVTYEYWGFGVLLVGLFVIGIGTFPMAIIIIIWNGLWVLLGKFVLVATLLYGSRLLGAFLISSE